MTESSRYAVATLVAVICLLGVVGADPAQEQREERGAHEVPDHEEAVSEMEWTRLSSTVVKNVRQIRAVDFAADQTFFTDGIRVFSALTHSDDSTDKIRIVGEPASQTGSVAFIKSFPWQRLLFLLVCRTDLCTFYQGSGLADLKATRILKYEGYSPVDASFFVHNLEPCIVVSYGNADRYAPTSHSVPAVIYRWTGSDVEMINEISTPPIKTITTFLYDQSSVIYFVLDGDESQTPQSENYAVYELDDRNNIRRLASAATGIVSIYPYYNDGEQFIFVTSEKGSNKIIHWNENHFESWLLTPPLIEPRIVRLAQLDDKTFLFVVDSVGLHVYTIDGHDLIPLYEFVTFDGESIVEMSVWREGKSLILALVKRTANDYEIRHWRLEFDSGYSETQDRIEDTFNEVKESLNDIEKLLESQAEVVEYYRNQWSLYASNTTEGISLPIKINILEANEVAISSLTLEEDESNSTTPSLSQLKANLRELSREVERISSKITADFTKRIRDVVSLSGSTRVSGDADFQELVIDDLHVERINNEKIDFNEYLINRVDQVFDKALEANATVIDNLQIESLCGVHFSHWLYNNGSNGSNLLKVGDLPPNSFANGDTIFTSDPVTLNSLDVTFVNDINIVELFDDAFVIGRDQVIEGNLTYTNQAEVKNLVLKRLNDVSATEHITKFTNQTLGDVYIDKLSVKKLFVDKINDVLVSEAARMSRENVIKGEVTINRLIIKDEFLIDDNLAIPNLTLPVQIYDDIVIEGDVFIKNLELEAFTDLKIGVESRDSLNIQDVLTNSWTTSSDQIIPGPTIFENGASIDTLHCRHLNGLGEKDFLYTDDYNMNDLENITFANFHFNKVFNGSSDVAETFVEETSNSFIFHKPVHISYLSVDNLYTDKYNGIPIENIMSGNDMILNFSEPVRFKVVQVNQIMTADELQADHLNHVPVRDLGVPLTTNQNLQLDELDVKSFKAKKLIVDKLNNINLEYGLQAQERLIDNLPKGISLNIEGDLKVDGLLEVAEINKGNVFDYVNWLKRAGIQESIGTSSIENLVVLGNVNVGSINGQNVDDVFASRLSKSGSQVLGEDFYCNNAFINYLDGKKINNKNISRLMFIDQPSNFYGNVSFARLTVQGDITSKTVQGYNISEWREKLRFLPLRDNLDLEVSGNVSWKQSSSDSYSLSKLLDSAVTKNDDQDISGSVIFKKSVTIDSLYLKETDHPVLEKVREITENAVLDGTRDDLVHIRGTKIFEKGLVVEDLTVTRNIDVERLNELNIEREVAQIYQKNEPGSILPVLTFAGEVYVDNLITESPIHGVPLSKLATIDGKLPEFLRFRKLRVDGNVTLHKIDNVDFDDFRKKRIDIKDFLEISQPVVFLQDVTVLNESYANLVNGIKPSDLVTNLATDESSVIHGKKIFVSKVSIHGDVKAASVNDLDIQVLYKRYAFKDKDVDIWEDLVFRGNVEIAKNVQVKGQINGTDSLLLANPRRTFEGEMSRALREKTSLEKLISKNNSTSPVKHFLYVEEDSSFNLHLPDVRNVRSSFIDWNVTRLDVYARETVTCDSKKDCTCARQYSVKLLPSNDYRLIPQKNSRDLVFNFYKLYDNTIGLRVVTRAASDSEYCPGRPSESGRSRVFWLVVDELEEIEQLALDIDGLILDAQAFVIDDQLYLTMVRSHGRGTSGNATELLLYRFGSTDRKSNGQSSLMEGASNIHVFKIDNVGIHALIGCVRGKAFKSSLLRFNPNTQRFRHVQTFTSGGRKHAASISVHGKNFIVLDNPDIEGVQIYLYNYAHDSFFDYQSLYLESRPKALNVLYTAGYGQGEALLTVTTKDGWLYVYEYVPLQKFQRKIVHWIEDLRVLSPFYHGNQSYLFIGTRSTSMILRSIQLML